MGLPNLSGSNIQDTYQRVLHTDGNLVHDGTGSLLPIAFESGNISASGNITANSSTLIEGSTSFPNKSGNGYKFGGSTTKRADSGFISDGVNAKTHITPQHTSKPMFFLGHHKDANNDVSAYPNNYITFNKKLFFSPNEGGGGVKPDSTKPTFQVDGNLQVVQPLNSNNTSSTDPKSGVLITPNPNIYFFNGDASGSISGSHQIASASAQISFDTGSNAVKVFAGSTDEDLIEVMHISRSGVNPRIGIGLEDPLTAFDFKSISDDNRGGELLIRGSRTLKGAEPNDEVGKISFAIDSGSYSDIKTSGSAAEIVAIVDAVDESGIQGSLSIRTAANKTGAPLERIHIGQSSTTVSGSLSVLNDVTISDDLTVNDYARIGALRVGDYSESTGDPGEENLYVNGHTVAYGGLKVGHSEDPGWGKLKVSSTATIEGGLILTGSLRVSSSYVAFPNLLEKSTPAISDDILILEGNYVKSTPQTALPYVRIEPNNTIPEQGKMLMFTGSSGTKEITTAPGFSHSTVFGYTFQGAGSALDINAGTVLFTSTTSTNITASANISASGTITATSFVGNMDGGSF